MDDITDNMDFNYVHILRLLYSSDELVQLLAGKLMAGQTLTVLKYIEHCDFWTINAMYISVYMDRKGV